MKIIIYRLKFCKYSLKIAYLGFIQAIQFPHHAQAVVEQLVDIGASLSRFLPLLVTTCHLGKERHLGKSIAW